jgi:hypothetical protein
MNESALDYPEIPALVGAASSIWQGGDVAVTIHIAASEKLREELKDSYTDGLESVFITDSDIRHIKRTHGAGEQKRGQVEIKPSDFAVIPLILNDFDSITHTNTDKLGNKRFLITKDIGDTAYIATIQRGKKKMEIKTFWKMKVSGASC